MPVLIKLYPGMKTVIDSFEKVYNILLNKDVVESDLIIHVKLWKVYSEEYIDVSCIDHSKRDLISFAM